LSSFDHRQQLPCDDTETVATTKCGSVCGRRTDDGEGVQSRRICGTMKRKAEKEREREREREAVEGGGRPTD
jgi:hypothetical protein